MNEEQTKRQRFPLGAWVRHPVHGRGRIVDYEGETYVTVFGNGVVQRIPSTFEGLALVESRDDEETSRLKRAVGSSTPKFVQGTPIQSSVWGP